MVMARVRQNGESSVINPVIRTSSRQASGSCDSGGSWEKSSIHSAAVFIGDAVSPPRSPPPAIMLGEIRVSLYQGRKIPKTQHARLLGAIAKSQFALTDSSFESQVRHPWRRRANFPVIVHSGVVPSGRQPRGKWMVFGVNSHMQMSP